MHTGDTFPVAPQAAHRGTRPRVAPCRVVESGTVDGGELWDVAGIGGRKENREELATVESQGEVGCFGREMGRGVGEGNGNIADMFGGFVEGISGGGNLPDGRKG